MNEALLAVQLLWRSEWVLNIDASNRYKVYSICIGEAHNPDTTASCSLFGAKEKKKQAGSLIEKLNLFFSESWEPTGNFLKTCDFLSVEYSGDRPDLGTKLECGVDDKSHWKHLYLRHRDNETRFYFEVPK